MTKMNNISDGEWEIMKCLWNVEYSTLPELTTKLKASKNWSNRAIQMMLTRMEKKELVKSMKEFSPIRYAAIVQEDECVKNENAFFLKKVYNGSISKMLMNFTEELSDEEIEELRELLNKKK